MIRFIRVLVADDNESFRVGFVEFINSQNGLKVIGEAKDGFEALKLTSLLKPDLVMIDVSMPNMDGIASAQLIKKQFPDTLIVIVTIHDEPVFKDLARLLPVDGFVCKASISGELPKVLKKLIAKVNIKHKEVDSASFGLS